MGGVVLVLAWILLLGSALQVQALAFPTAEGFGANSVGGRGGAVYKVTTLADARPAPANSFRACAEATGPRTCIFEVAGTIKLVDSIFLFEDQSNLTIAGQTAPGDGVQIKGPVLELRDGVHDIIIRHMRFRQDIPHISYLGDPGAYGYSQSYDPQTVMIYQSGFPSPGQGIHDIILDHVEITWACHNNLNLTGNVENLTVQWSIIAEPQWEHNPYCEPTGCTLENYQTGEPDPGNCFGMGMIAITYSTQGPQTYSIHHNLLSGIYARGPNLSGTTSNDVNAVNVVYDWRNNIHYNGVGCMPDNIGLSDYGDGPASTKVNWVGNLIIPGPSSPNGDSCYPGALAGATTKVYVHDNWSAECANNCLDPNEWNLGWVDDRDGMGASNPPPQAHFRTMTPHTVPAVFTHASNQLENEILNRAGPTKPRRDTMTQRFLNELANRQGAWGKEEAPWPTLTLAGATVPTDSDGDGMPDSWEQQHGRNPSVSDGHTTNPATGYTYLEDYLNVMAGDGEAPAPSPSLEFVQQPTSEEVGAVITPSVTVRVTDGAGNTNTSSTAAITVALGNNPSGATLQGTKTRNAVSGVATFDNLALSAAGSNYTLVATATDLLSATSQPFTVTPVGGAVPTSNPIYISRGGHGDSPTDGDGSVQSCLDAENTVSPKATIAGALACMTVPHKKLIFRGGTYPEVFDSATTPITGGTSWETATQFESYPGETAIIAPNTGTPLWLHNSNSYLIFKNLTIDALQRSGVSTVVINGGNHIRFIDTIVQNGGVANFDLTNTDAIEITSAAAAPGPWLSHTSRIQHAFGHGVATHGTTTNLLIEKTIVTDNEPSGLALNLTSGSHTNPRIRRNTFNFNGFDSSQFAIQVGTGSDAAIENNLLFTNYAGIRVGGTATNARLDHNTIVSHTTLGVQCDNGASTIRLRNTLLWNNGTNAPLNNCSLQQTTNRTTDPLFTNLSTNDLTLAPTSPAINAGTPLTEVTTDYLGSARPEPNGTDYDQGAYESGSTTPPTGAGMGPLLMDSSNPRYFRKPNGDLVYLAGSYLWNFAYTMSDADAEDYLDFWVQTGHNMIRAPTNDPTFETVSPPESTPFHAAYFAKLEQRLALAQSKGIYVILPLLAHINAAPYNDLPYVEAYLRHAVTVAVPYDNVLFEVGNELYEYQYNGGNVGSIVDYWVTVINDQQADLGYTGASRRPVGLSDFLGCGFFFGECADVVTYLKGSSADFISIGRSETGQHVDAVPADVGDGFHVSIVDTDHIWAYNLNHNWVWRTFMRGHNVLVLDGNWFFPDHSENDNLEDSPLTFDARMRIGDTQTYAQKMNLRAAVPTPGASTTGYALVNPGVQYLVYQPGSGAFQVTLVAGEYTVEWFNASTQVTTPAAPITASGATTFTPPASGDHVLFLQAAPEEPPPAGAQVRVYEQSWFH